MPIPKGTKFQCCRRGHPFTPSNTYIRPDGRRQCRTCGRLRQLVYKNRRALAAKAESLPPLHPGRKL